MNKEVGGFHLKPLFRILVAISIIAFAASITAVSCGKTPAAGGGGTTANNNSGNNNSGGGGNNPVVLGPVDPVIKVTAVKAAADANLVKVDASGNVKINAGELASVNAFAPRTASIGDGTISNAMRLIEAKNTNLPALFTIELMRNSTNAAEGGMIFHVNQKTTPANDTNKNNITFNDSAVGLTHASGSGAEGTQNVWRRSVDTAGANFYQIVSYNRPFDDIAAGMQNQALGLLICATEKLEKVHNATTATDATKLPFAKATCYIGIYVFDWTLGGLKNINDAWVALSVTTKEEDIRLMGVYTGNTGLGSLSDATGWTKDTFFGALNNTAMQGIFTKNKYVEKSIKTTIVTSTDFAALP